MFLEKKKIEKYMGKCTDTWLYAGLDTVKISSKNRPVLFSLLSLNRVAANDAEEIKGGVYLWAIATEAEGRSEEAVSENKSKHTCPILRHNEIPGTSQ